MATSECQKAAVKKYNKEHTTQFNVRLNYKTDADVIEKLSQVPASRKYVKQLILQDIARGEDGLCPEGVNTPGEAGSESGKNYADYKNYLFRLDYKEDRELINMMDTIRDKSGFIRELLVHYLSRESNVPGTFLCPEDNAALENSISLYETQRDRQSMNEYVGEA